MVKTKNGEEKVKLDHPVKVYFNEDDYLGLVHIANEQGLELSQFIRNKMKCILQEEINKEYKAMLLSVSRDTVNNKTIFNNLILKLSFSEVQFNNTPSRETKDLILENIKKLIDQVLSLLIDNKAKQYKKQLYDMINDNINVQNIIDLKLERYLKNN